MRTQIKKGILVSLSLFMIALLSACTNIEPVEDTKVNELTMTDEFVLPAGPELMDVQFNEEKAPLYMFLFTHTEDQFNHELAEERFWRGGEIISNLAKEFPNIEIPWTIEFQGTDANSLVERNSSTGLLDYLLSLKDDNLIHFGYHAWHDATYLNRPQKELKSDSSFDEVYDAISTWISCELDPLVGGCIAETGGGITTILKNFGEVSVVTGLGGYSGGSVQYQRSAGNAAVLDLLPDMQVSFAFPDHGGALQMTDYTENKAAFMDILAPTHETSSYAFWMDNEIQLNDAPISTIDGPQVAEDEINEVDRERPQLMNVHFMSKYIYADTSSSPTKWGYANPDSPELPDNLLNSDAKIETNYSLTEQAMDFLMSFVAKDTAGSQFVWEDDIVNLFVSDDYLKVDKEELYNLSLWLLNNWNDQTPSWAYDGEDYYSLTDSIFALIYGLRDKYPKSGIVSEYYGPWSLTEARTQYTEIPYNDLLSWVNEVDLDTKALDESLTIGGKRYTPSQVLYALAYVYVMDYNGEYSSQIAVPSMLSTPETYVLLEGLGCKDCLDTVWSLKPARFQNLEGDYDLFDGIDPIEFDSQESNSNGKEFNHNGATNKDSDKFKFH